MTFILIMSTLGRTDDLVRFFESLTTQGPNSFKIYLCDQNDDRRLLPIIAVWANRLPIKIVHSDKGLSRGRNAALAAALADARADGDYVVAFPDDDCWYSKDVLSKVSKVLSENQALSGVTGRSMSEKGKPSSGSSPNIRTELTPGNLFRGSMGISYCIFLRLGVVKRVGMFDETLGVGAGTKWGSGEESDYLLRTLRQQVRLRYEPDIQIFHPDKDVVLDGARFLAYARGHGRILRLNGYSWATVIKDVLVALAAFLIKSLWKRRVMYPYLYRAWGYLQGYRATDPRPMTAFGSLPAP
jgi:glycosyltransferase involved in cell wall biosynthesis